MNTSNPIACVEVVMPLLIPTLIAAGFGALASTGIKKAREGTAAMQRAQELVEGAQRRHELCRQRHAAWSEAVRERSEALDRVKGVTLASFQLLDHLLGRLRRRSALEPCCSAMGVEVRSPSEVGASFVPGRIADAAAAAPEMGSSLGWLGSSALVASGLMVPCGALVGLGLAAGPAMAVAGFMMEVEGEEKLSAASAYAERLDGATARMEEEALVLQGVCARMDLLHGVARALFERLGASADALETIASFFDPGREEHLARLSLVLQHARALAEVLSAPLLPQHEGASPAAASMGHYVEMDQGSAQPEEGGA